MAVVRENDAQTPREMFLDQQLTKARLAARSSALALVSACDEGSPDRLSALALDASLAAADLRAALRAVALSAAS